MAEPGKSKSPMSKSEMNLTPLSPHTRFTAGRHQTIKTLLLLGATTIWLGTAAAVAQISGGPSANCHVTDGTFTACTNGQTEWSDVQPLFFPASNSFLYVNQDPAHTLLFLMYDFPNQTTNLGASDNVHIKFATVENGPSGPALVFYEVLIRASGPITVLENGQPTPAGSFVAAAGFGPSPNSSTPHLTAEFQVPLVGELPPGIYSPDPIFWVAAIPPPPPLPPPPCAVEELGVCIKTQAQVQVWNQEAAAAFDQAVQDLEYRNSVCDQPLQQLEAQFEQAGEALTAIVPATKALIEQANLGSPLTTELTSELTALEEAAQNLLTAPGSPGPGLVGPVEAAATALATTAAAVTGPVIAANLANVLAAAGALVLAAVALEAFNDLATTVGCRQVYAVKAAAEFAIGELFLTLAQDPSDPNFTVIATPVVPPLSVDPTAAGFSSQVANDFNSLFSNWEQQISLLQTIPITLNRESGAIVAGNAFWQAQQAQAVHKYASQLISLLKNELQLRTALTNDFAASGPAFTFSSNDVSNTLSVIKQNGFPPDVTSALTQLGVDSTTQATILQTALATDPVLVASAGTGAFPGALSDSSFAASTNDAINAFSELAAVTIFSDFGPDFGSNNSTNGSGSCVSGNTTPNCGPLTYRWIAAPFTPSDTFTLGRIDLALGYVSGTNGAVLNLVNDLGGLPGATVLESWSVTNVPFSCPFCHLSPIVTLDSVSGPTLLSGTQYWLVAEGLAGDTLTFWWGSPLSGSAGTLLSLNQGASWICCLSSAAFDVRSTPRATPPGPVTTATAAVVEANGNGDTVSNLRGLAPTDVPTLQDQIQMIVQFRVIQNPLTDATQLTTQLVNSLPPSILPPDQANTIINAVVGSLVPPPAVISGMPGAGCSLWPPNGKLVQVATITASDAVSGIQPGSFTVTGTSNEPQTDPDTPEIVITPDPSGGFVVQLQAARLGTGTGRIYTLTATAANSAGVRTTVTSTCTVPHDQGN